MREKQKQLVKDKACCGKESDKWWPFYPHIHPCCGYRSPCDQAEAGKPQDHAVLCATDGSRSFTLCRIVDILTLNLVLNIEILGEIVAAPILLVWCNGGCDTKVDPVIWGGIELRVDIESANFVCQMVSWFLRLHVERCLFISDYYFSDFSSW